MAIPRAHVSCIHSALSDCDIHITGPCDLTQLYLWISAFLSSCLLLMLLNTEGIYILQEFYFKIWNAKCTFLGRWELVLVPRGTLPLSYIPNPFCFYFETES